jgi:hypothetical protein
MMFIAIENAASAYGYKRKNTPKKPTTTRTKSAQKKRDEANEIKYKARQELAEAVGFDPKVDESEGNFLFEARMFAEKHKDLCRYGVSGSLRSMLKRAAFECENGGLTFHTLVLVGHGNTSTNAASFSGGRTLPSGYPSAQPTPALVVAIAFAPTSSNSRALPASQALGRIRSSEELWRCRN